MTEPLADILKFGVDLTSVRDRLSLLNYFLAVEDLGSASEILSAEDQFSFSPPAAFVSIASETAQRDRVMRGAGGHSQRIDIVLSVVFAETASRMDRARDEQVEATRKAIIRQLMFWKPTGAQQALQYDRYLLRATGGGLIWGECLFRTSYLLAS